MEEGAHGMSVLAFGLMVACSRCARRSRRSHLRLVKPASRCQFHDGQNSGAGLASHDRACRVGPQWPRCVGGGEASPSP